MHRHITYSVGWIITLLILFDLPLRGQEGKEEGKEPCPMTLQDHYKQAYQAYWGAEHMAPDSASVRRYLEYELSQCDTMSMRMPDIQAIGNYYRVSLRLVLRGVISPEELTNAFIASSYPIEHARGEWAKQWEATEKECLEHYPWLQNDTLSQMLRHAAELEAAVHHSDSFRAYYHPHYRIIRKDIIDHIESLQPYLP